VAIIGRPNVGKSTLINRIVRGRKAIVDDMPGVTRDRTYHEAEWCGRPFTLVDTGGVVPGSEELFETLINEQVEIALLEADVVIFLLDGQAGVTDHDDAVAKRIRKAGKPTLVAVNKIDTPNQLAQASEFYSLGLGDPVPLSALHGTGGVGDLLDAVVAKFSVSDDEDAPAAADDETIRLTLVGRPNVGKSSLVNALLGNQRTIVSEVSGTTRDAIDIPFTWEGKPFVLVDTAGIRAKRKVDYGVEMFSVDRSIRSLRRSDVVVMVLDAVEGVTDQDKKLLTTCNEAGKALVLVVNKWDMVANKHTNSTEEFKKKLLPDIPHAAFAEIVFTSAKTGQRVQKILEAATRALENNRRRVKTALINEVILDAYHTAPPPPIKNKRLKILYATQVKAGPPTFVLFVNDDKLFKDSYKRYLERKLRDSFEFTGTPLAFVLRNRSNKDSVS
jgi:GTP-binding protein